jgi:hypothetical protein
MIELLDTGNGPGGPQIPCEDTRKLMTAIAQGLQLEPWPLSTAELQAAEEKKKRAG